MKLWNRLLIFLHLRRDWAKELELSPPAWPANPHAFDPTLYSGETLTYCAQCGGGPRHPIHAGMTKCPFCVDGVATYPHGPDDEDKGRCACMNCAGTGSIPPTHKPGPWGKIHARSLEAEQRRSDREV